jgi:hypothetical protein
MIISNSPTRIIKGNALTKGSQPEKKNLLQLPMLCIRLRLKAKAKA